jgi:hypothetical protein
MNDTIPPPTPSTSSTPSTTSTTSTTSTPAPKQLGIISRWGRGVFIKPADIQKFETTLGEYKQLSMTDPFDTTKRIYAGYDENRYDKIRSLQRKISEKINDYVKSYDRPAPITIQNNLGITGMDEPFEKALTKVTVKRKNNTLHEYVGDTLNRLKKDHHYYVSYGENRDRGFSWHQLMKDVSSKSGGFVGSSEATLTFELDMSRLINNDKGGRRRRPRFSRKTSTKRGRSMTPYVSKSKKHSRRR